MYRPVCYCGRCTRAATEELPAAPGQAFTRMLQRRTEVHEEGIEAAGPRTGMLYGVPRQGQRGSDYWAPECMTWPRYSQGSFSLAAREGESMLDLTAEEKEAL